MFAALRNKLVSNSICPGLGPVHLMAGSGDEFLSKQKLTHLEQSIKMKQTLTYCAGRISRSENEMHVRIRVQIIPAYRYGGVPVQLLISDIFCHAWAVLRYAEYLVDG